MLNYVAAFSRDLEPFRVLRKSWSLSNVISDNQVRSVNLP